LPQLLLAAIALACATGAVGQIAVLTPAVLDPDAPIPDAVKAECRLPEVMGDQGVRYINRQLRRQGGARKISSLQEAGRARAIALTIVAVYGQGATYYSGAKALTVRADIIEDGKVVDSRLVRAATGRGAMGTVFGGACASFERAAKFAAGRIGKWAMTAAFASARPPAAHRVAIEAPARAAEDARLPEAVTRECGLPMMVSLHAFDRISAQYAGSRIVKDGEAAEGKLLRLVILDVDRAHAEGVAAPKAITLRADLLEDGKVIASNVFERSSNSKSPIVGTCMILEHAAIELGMQITRWLGAGTALEARGQPLDVQDPMDADESASGAEEDKR